MRRLQVYERTTPRARRDEVSAVTLARYLGQALTEAERIVRRTP